MFFGLSEVEENFLPWDLLTQKKLNWIFKTKVFSSLSFYFLCETKNFIFLSGNVEKL
jgi:hypothetical protein